MRSKISGVGSIRDFASRYWGWIAVWAAAVVIVVGVTAAWVGYQGAFRDAVGKFSPCLGGVQLPSNSHDIGADINAGKDAGESSDSCKKIVSRLAHDRRLEQLERYSPNLRHLPH